MRSPFPGMNPWLELRWKNFHVYFINGVARAINRQLGDDLLAVAEEDVKIGTLAGEAAYGYTADVAVVEYPDRPTRDSHESDGGVAVAEPIKVKFLTGPIVRRHVEIIDRGNGNRVVTAVEVLSPWNKRAGQLNRDYLAKLADYSRSRAHWVEVDLLRSSRARMSFTWDALPERHHADYLGLVHRARKELIDAYPMRLRERLAILPIPLRRGEADARLDLQAVLDEVWQEHRLHVLVDYADELRPRLSPTDAAWAAERIAASTFGGGK